jgi:23S rRNA (uracil1939-C5)-methyltransferase
VPPVFCPHQPACTGCPLSDLPYAEQLQAKSEIVRAEMGHWPVLETVSLAPVVGAETNVHYRVRAKLVHKDGKLGLFTHEHDVVDTPSCRIVHPRLQAVLNELRALLPLPTPLLAVDARLSDAGVLLTLVVPHQTREDVVQRSAELVSSRIPDVCGVAYSERQTESPRVLGGVPVPVLGEREAPHTLAAGRPYHLAVFGGFVQAHPLQAAALHDLIIRELEERFGALAGLRVVELYAGAGALALQLASLGANVTAVDSYVPSVELLERTARAQRLRLTTRTTTAEAALSELNSEQSRADVIVVDPPRRGLSVEVRRAIAQAAPKLVVYVSCSPRTLTRDLSHLTWLGYRGTKVVPVDMIPQSSAVETLTFLTSVPQPRVTVIHQDARLVAVDKPAHLPTTPHAEHNDNLLHLVRNLPGCEHAVPVHRLDAGTSGVCLFARRPEFAEGLGAALSRGQKTYVALAQGITNKRGTIRKKLLEGRVPRDAETKYARTKVVGTHSLIHAFPVHGRKHQIRRHFAAVGHPLLGDSKYAKSSSSRFVFERYGLDRPFLHCGTITLVHEDRELELRSPLPPDLTLVLESLSRKSQVDAWRDD